MNRLLFQAAWYVCAVALILCCFSSCVKIDIKPSDNDETGRRTVLVYIGAENSLSYGHFHEQDLDEMLRAASDIPSDCKLLAYIDDNELPRIVSIEKGPDTAVSKLVKTYAEDHNSASPQVLHDVMSWAVDTYPSESYGLVMWSHGEAWLPARAPQRSIVIDNEDNGYSNHGSKMEIAEMREALSNLPRLDFILFDACFMQSIEVAYELRTVTHYIIASPAEIPNPGAPYDLMLSAMFSQPISLSGIVDGYYNYYQDNMVPVYAYGTDRYGISLSVVNCDVLEDLAALTAEMVVKYVDSEEALDLAGIQRYYPISFSSRPEYFDMNGVMSRIISDDADYIRWKRAFDAAVPYRRTTSWWYSNDAYMQQVDTVRYGGVSCYVPQHDNIYSKLNDKFRQTSWYKVSGWARVGW